MKVLIFNRTVLITLPLFIIAVIVYTLITQPKKITIKEIFRVKDIMFSHMILILGVEQHMGPPSYGESIKQKNILILTLHKVEISYL